VVDVEAYAEGRLIGGFRKLFRPPVPIHRPRDPVYAESEISIDPYPVLPGKSTKLGVEVFNPTPYDRVVEATFSVAPFGIGLPFKADGITPNPIMIYVPAHGAARGHVIWTPPPSVRGKVCVQVELEIDGHVMWSRRNIDVGEPLRPGIPHSMTFPVSTDTYTEPVTITLGVIRHKGEWDVSLSHETLTDVQPGETVPVTLTVTPPFTVTLGSGEPIADVEAYVEGRLLGGFRKLDVPPIPLHKPHEKGYAESEIRIDPYPPREGEPTQVSVDVQNTSEQPMTVDLTFGWAKFGMGIPFTTTGVMPYTRSVTLSPEMTATASVTWIPQLSGVQCVRVLLDDPEGVYGRQESQRNVDVIEEPPCGETKVFSFTVYNDTPFSMTVDIGMVTFNVPANWVVTTVPSDTLELGPFSEGTVTVTVEIPCPETAAEWRAQREIAVLQQGSGGVPTIDVEGYAGGDLVGGIEIQFTSPLPAPSDLSATAISHAQIGLNWTDNSTDETAFHIERSPDGVDEWTEVAAVASDETSYSDGSLQCETTYYYRVRAFRSGDGVYSSYSDVASDTTGMCPPDPPTGVAASDGAYTDRVAVTWESVSGATEYEVYRATSAAGAKVFQASASMTTYDDTTATPGAVYTYWVTACNASGCSDYSAPDTGWRKLLAPAGVTASDGVYTDRVAVSWDSVSGASEYEVYRATSPIGTKFHIGTTSLTAYDDATGTAGATYSYWVKACSDPGCSDYSAPDTGWRALPAPTGLTATPVSRTQIDLSWTDNSADETAFHIERSLDGGTDWDEIAVVGADVTAYSDVDLDCGTEYAYRVRAYQSTNGVYSAYSDPATARTAVCSFDVYLPLITR
ncbi:MAG: fibronectin type III domain-containing protein, partial [Anaerolineae bacterium]|nr:fibronectin type III domain-containing protein [Anaerolineae bacterium]